MKRVSLWRKFVFLPAVALTGELAIANSSELHSEMDTSPIDARGTLVLKPFSVYDRISLIGAAATALPSVIKPNDRLHPIEEGVVILNQGDMETGGRRYSLMLYQLDARGVEYPARWEELLRFETRAAEEAIEGLSWFPEQRQLAFLGRGKETLDKAQVYLYDLDRRSLRQLTRDADSVALFNLALTPQKLVYSTVTLSESFQGRRPRDVIGLDAKMADNLSRLTSSPNGRAALAYYAMDLRTGNVVRIRSDDPRALTTFPSHVSISPSGRWAVRTAFLGELPQSWADYDVVRVQDLRPEDWQGLGWRSSQAAFGGIAGNVLQLQLMDLEHGRTRPLIDSPFAPESWEQTSRDFGHVQPFTWIDDERHIAVAGSYMPMYYSRTPFLVEVSLETGKIVRIDDLEGSRGKMSQSVTAPLLEMIIQDTLTTPPALAAWDRRSDLLKVIAPLNSSSPELQMGRVQRFRWIDRLGGSHEGGLIVRSDDRTRSRGPVVVQLNGWDDGLPFLVADVTSHPSRLFLSRGIEVLQVSCMGQHGELAARYSMNVDFGLLRTATSCLEGALNALAKGGIGDPKRIGLLGFSFAGNHVYHSVTYGQASYAAALVVDSVQGSAWCYAMFYGSLRFGMSAWDSPVPENYGMNAAFLGKGIERWIERSPMFHLDEMRTPLLYEHHGLGVSPNWDTNAILKGAQRPVELANYPDGAHDLSRVSERYASQEATLDWFDFWLNGHEDPSPQKYTQYDRWHTLRSQQHQHYRQVVKASGA